MAGTGPMGELCTIDMFCTGRELSVLLSRTSDATALVLFLRTGEIPALPRLCGRQLRLPALITSTRDELRELTFRDAATAEGFLFAIKSKHAAELPAAEELAPLESAFLLELIGRRYRAERCSILMDFIILSFLHSTGTIAAPSSPVDRRGMLRKRFISLVAVFARQEHQVAFYADKLCISTGYLSKIMKPEGITPKQLISRQIITEATILLRATGQELSVLSDLLGFADASAFNSFFKKQTGMSPGRFRLK